MSEVASSAIDESDESTPEPAHEEDAPLESIGEVETSAPIAKAEKLPTRARKILTANLASYPIVFAVGVALAPIALRMMTPSEVWEPSQDELTRAVAMRLLVPCLLTFLLLHVTALPWIFAKDEARAARGKKIFVAADVLIASFAIFGGAASWFLLLYK